MKCLRRLIPYMGFTISGSRSALRQNRKKESLQNVEYAKWVLEHRGRYVTTNRLVARFFRRKGCHVWTPVQFPGLYAIELNRKQRRKDGNV